MNLINFALHGYMVSCCSWPLITPLPITEVAGGWVRKPCNLTALCFKWQKNIIININIERVELGMGKQRCQRLGKSALIEFNTSPSVGLIFSINLHRMNTNSPGSLMALPKSLYLISTSQSDLFPVLMGLPVLDHVGAWEGMGWLCHFQLIPFIGDPWISAQRLSDQAEKHIQRHKQRYDTTINCPTSSSYLIVYYEKPGSSQVIITQ